MPHILWLVENNFNPEKMWVYYLDYHFYKRRRKRRRGTRRGKVEEERGIGKRERRGSEEKGEKKKAARKGRGGKGGKSGPHRMLNMDYPIQSFK